MPPSRGKAHLFTSRTADRKATCKGGDHLDRPVGLGLIMEGVLGDHPTLTRGDSFLEGHALEACGQEGQVRERVCRHLVCCACARLV